MKKIEFLDWMVILLYFIIMIALSVDVYRDYIFNLIIIHFVVYGYFEIKVYKRFKNLSEENTSLSNRNEYLSSENEKLYNENKKLSKEYKDLLVLLQK